MRTSTISAGAEVVQTNLDWTGVVDDPAELRRAFAAAPDNRYRPLTAWWWSGEPLEKGRLLWQLQQIHDMGCGGVAITSLAPFGPAGGSRGDEPRVGTEARARLLRVVLQRCRELGLGVVLGSPFQAGGLTEINHQLAAHPDYRAELILPGPRVMPYGYDLGNPAATAALQASDTIYDRVDRVYAEFEDRAVGLFEDEVWPFALWSPGFADEFRRLKGDDPPPWPFHDGDDPRLPAQRWAMYDVARARAEAAYTEPMRRLVEERRLLGGYDQMSRRGTPIMSTIFYLDPFRVMSWANAPGTDQMGDARFHLSIADLTGARRVWLEGFHSHGQGLSLGHTFGLIAEWVREGSSLFLPHGMYYSSRGMWWEWAPPEMGWRQPFARHYPAFAEMVGRLLTVGAAGRHRPEVAVLYPLSTIWADTVAHLEMGAHAQAAERLYCQLMGVHGQPVWDDPGVWQQPSLLADACYDRIAVHEEWLDRVPELPLIVPGCICLPRAVLEALIARAQSGCPVIVIEPLPAWSAEVGADDPELLALAERLRSLATIAATAAEAVAALPPPRVSGLRSQWRTVGDLDLLIVTGSGEVRVRKAGPRRAQRWEFRDGTIQDVSARLVGEDLIVDVDGPLTLLGLPAGQPTEVDAPRYREMALPERWECEYLSWGENRWGDLRLPSNPGTPPVERRTFAWREGDGDGFHLAPVVPEDVQQPLFRLGFEDRMGQAQGRARPAERDLGGGWREVVSTFGPRATLDGAPVIEYSERFGIEDLVLSTPLGLKGWVEPWKADLGVGGRGRVVSHAHLERARQTHLVVEAVGIVSVELDGRPLIGPVEGGVLSLPVSLEAGWHQVAIDIEPREVDQSGYRGYSLPPRSKLSWGFMSPSRPTGSVIWGGRMIHPDYRGAAEARRFRRRVRLPGTARVKARSWAAGAHTLHIPERLEAGEHTLEAFVAAPLVSPGFSCEIDLELEAGTLHMATDGLWESLGPGEEWSGVHDLGASSPLSGREGEGEGEPVRQSLLLDVAWLHGDQAAAEHAERCWSDSPEPPPPSWFCFLAPPGARSMTLPIEGEVRAWLDGEEVRPADGRLALRERARVALRVQAPAGGRGAACFTEHPVLELGVGTLRSGVSWHRQGLDCFAGVILHRTTVTIDKAAEAVLDLGRVVGSVAVRLNGTGVGTLVWEPWRLPLELEAGENLIELEVAGTLGPLVGRGVPTPFGPEDQRFCGILGTPRLLLRDG